MPVELVMFVKQLLSISKEQTGKLQAQFTDTFYLAELIKIFNMVNDSMDLQENTKTLLSLNKVEIPGIINSMFDQLSVMVEEKRVTDQQLEMFQMEMNILELSGSLN